MNEIVGDVILFLAGCWIGHSVGYVRGYRFWSRTVGKAYQKIIDTQERTINLLDESLERRENGIR